MRTVRASLGVLAVGVVAFMIATVLIGTRATPAPSDGLASRATPSVPASASEATGDSAAGQPGATEDADASEPEAGDGDDDAAAEAAEQGEGVQRRREAFEAADAVGAAGQAGARSYVEAAAGTTAWVGEAPISATADDWEPAIATDASSRVFLLTTRYGAKPCSGNCPSPYIALTISQNGGVSWGAPKPALRLQGIRPVRPDHRGRAVDRGGLRGIPQRLQRHVHQVDRPRRDLVRAGQDVRQRVLDRQAGTGHERRRHATSTCRSTARRAAIRTSHGRPTPGRPGARSR